MTDFSTLTTYAKLRPAENSFFSEELKSAVEKGILNNEIDELIGNFCTDLLTMEKSCRHRIKLACRVTALLPDNQLSNSKRIFATLNENKIGPLSFSTFFTDNFIDGTWDQDTEEASLREKAALRGDEDCMSPNQRESYDIDHNIEKAISAAIELDHIASVRVLADNLPSVEFFIKFFPWSDNSEKNQKKAALILEKWNLWKEISEEEKQFFYKNSSLDFETLMPFLNFYGSYSCKEREIPVQVLKILLRSSNETPLPLEVTTGKRVEVFDRTEVLPMLSFLSSNDLNLSLLSKESLVDLLISRDLIPPASANA